MFECSRIDPTPAISPAISVAEIQVGQPHLANPTVHSSLIGASLPLVYARKLAVSSGFGHVGQLGPSDLPSPRCLI